MSHAQHEGAVYYTRQTAGEQDHYHRNCDCKIGAGIESDPYAEILMVCKDGTVKAV